MPPNKIVKEDRSKIDLIINTANQLRKIIQIQDADEGTTALERPEDQLRGMIQTKDADEGAAGERTTLSGTQSVDGRKKNITSEAGLPRTQSAPSLPTHIDHGEQIDKLKDALRRLRRNLKYMKSVQLDVENEINEQISELKPMERDAQSSEKKEQLSSVDEDAHPKQVVDEGTQLRDILADWTTKSDLKDITDKLLALISKVPEKRKKKKVSPDYVEGLGDDKAIRLLCLPGIHANKDLKSLEVFRRVTDEFDKLSTNRQLCLLSFSVFPENQEVNRTMLMYWWIGEGILPDKINQEESILPDNVKPEASNLLVKLMKRGSADQDKTDKDRPEDVVKDILKEFVDKKLIEAVDEAVENKRKVEPNSYKMTPFVHAALVIISKEIGLYDIYHKDVKKPTMNRSDLNKVCLVEGSSSQNEAKCKLKEAEHIETVFNVSEAFPDFTSKWFSSMKKLKVLYLGRWERTEREVIVDSRRIMKNLSSMKKLRFLSFQGISSIKSLSRSVCKLKELIILDLRGCDYLDKLPEDIRKLENLVYLDLTDCDAFENIPMGLAELSKLEVLKGFVVGDGREIACTLSHLNKLENLRKLSISIDRDVFGLDELLTEINGFKALENLKVQWGSRIPLSKKKVEGNKSRDADATVLPKLLKKLDLQRFPDSELPYWLLPQNLNHLEKLYLGSWKHLKGFGAVPEKPNESVKVLRLRCLPNLKVEWRELTESYFSKLNFVESFECPRVTFSPCDRNGIWRADTTTL